MPDTWTYWNSADKSPSGVALSGSPPRVATFDGSATAVVRALGGAYSGLLAFSLKGTSVSPGFGGIAPASLSLTTIGTGLITPLIPIPGCVVMSCGTSGASLSGASALCVAGGGGLSDSVAFHLPSSGTPPANAPVVLLLKLFGGGGKAWITYNGIGYNADGYWNGKFDADPHGGVGGFDASVLDGARAAHICVGQGHATTGNGGGEVCSWTLNSDGPFAADAPTGYEPAGGFFEPTSVFGPGTLSSDQLTFTAVNGTGPITGVSTGVRIGVHDKVYFEVTETVQWTSGVVTPVDFQAGVCTEGNGNWTGNGYDSGQPELCLTRNKADGTSGPLWCYGGNTVQGTLPSYDVSGLSSTSFLTRTNIYGVALNRNTGKWWSRMIGGSPALGVGGVDISGLAGLGPWLPFAGDASVNPTVVNANFGQNELDGVPSGWGQGWPASPSGVFTPASQVMEF